MSQSPHRSSDWSPLHLERALTTVVTAVSNGFEYRVSIAVPDEPQPEAGFPMLLVLDGAALFPTVAETERRLSRRSSVTRVVPTVIVGVGPADVDLYETDQRRRDFTSGPAAEAEDDAQGPVGGAEAFTAFLIDQVLPLAFAQAPIDRSRTALMGHSLAGYFTLDILTTRPELFPIYGAISPSIWWNRERVMTAATAVSGLETRVMLAVGALEQKPDEADPRRRGRRVVSSVEEVGAVLRSAFGFNRVDVTVFPEEDHASVVSVAIVRMLRLIAG